MVVVAWGGPVCKTRCPGQSEVENRWFPHPVAV